MTNPNFRTYDPDNRLIILLAGIGLFIYYYYLFGRFFPNGQGCLGHDYGYQLPLLLNGYYWFFNNGIFSVPWFSPSFCGGVPLLANPASIYYSIPQFLAFIVDPLTSVKITFFLFAGLGYCGFYGLLTRIYKVNPWAAVTGSTLFLFNGFYSHHMITGHLEFHSFMLIPLTSWLLLKPVSMYKNNQVLRFSLDIATSSLLIAYMFISGMINLIVPVILTILLMAFITGLIKTPDFCLRDFLVKFTVAGVLALGLTATKIAAALAFLQQFPRDMYPLPGVDGIAKLFIMLIQSLMFGGSSIDVNNALVNTQWLMQRHEWEFGITFIPFLIIIAGLLLNRKNVVKSVFSTNHDRSTYIYLALTMVLLLVPFMLNYYSPQWNAFLKTVPLIRNVTLLLRWFCIYIPVIILLTTIILASVDIFRVNSRLLALLSVSSVLLLNAATNRNYYHQENYNPADIVNAYSWLKTGNTLLPISAITVYLDEQGQIITPVNRNDAMARGYSQLLCYEHMFGFLLELFPIKTLHPGPVMQQTDGLLNLKNPACYL
jgi:hypothetical protein